MNGYKVIIWASVEHNGEFTHNSERIQIVHAETVNGARAHAEAELNPGHIYNIGDNLTIKVNPEFIYKIYYIGKVRYKTVIEYDKE